MGAYGAGIDGPGADRFGLGQRFDARISGRLFGDSGDHAWHSQSHGSGAVDLGVKVTLADLDPEANLLELH